MARYCFRPFLVWKTIYSRRSGYDNGTGGVYLNNLIWKNNKGFFSFLSKTITVPNIKPAYLKGVLINNQFKFIGIETNVNTSSLNIYEIPVIFLLKINVEIPTL